MYSVIAALDSK